MLFNISEIIDIIVMTLVIGFIFKDVFQRRPRVEVFGPDYDPLQRYQRSFNWDDFWFAVAVVAPSIILHEFGHKFFAIANGMTAEFHADYFWLAIALILKLIGFGFIFLVPAFTSISGAGSHLQMAGVAFAGPAVNLVLWLGSAAVIKHMEKRKRNHSRLSQSQWYHILVISRRVNMFLFIFNMLPIPMFDGWSVYSNLLANFFGW